jgi:hypothetical protein
MSFPPPITSMKLRVSTGSYPNFQTFEEPITTAALGPNMVPITPELVSTLNDRIAGTIFIPSIVTTYEGDSLPPIYTTSVSNFVPKKITPNISLANIPNKFTSDAPFYLSSFIITDSTGALSYSSSLSSVAIVSPAGLVTIVGTGTTTITVNQAASSDEVYTAATPVTASFQVLPLLSPTLGTFSLHDDVSLYMNQPITRQLTPPTSNSNGSFVYTSSNTAVATITNNAGVYSINVIGGGTSIITAIQTASGIYASKSVSSTLVVSVVYPTLGTFSLPTDIIYMNETITRQLTPPTSNSSGAFTFTSSNTAVATITNHAGVSSINVIGGGSTTITAIQAESGTYASTSVSSTLVILLSPTLGTFSLHDDVSLYMNQTITRQLTPPTSNSNGSFVYTSSNTAVATITNNAGVYSINVIGGGTSIIYATQSASDIYASKSVSSTLVVSVVYPTLGTFSLPTDVSLYMNETITRQLTPPTSNSSGAFTFTSSNTAVATITNNAGVYSINVISAGTSIITAIQAESGTYASTSVSSILVILLSPTLGTFSLPTDIIYMNQTITRQLTPPTSNSNGSFVYTSSNTDVATITNNAGVSSINVNGFGTIVITAIQAESGIYASKSVSSTLVILTPPSISFPNLQFVSTTRYLMRLYNEGTPYVETPINISSNSSGSFSFTIDTSYAPYNAITINNQLRNVNVPTSVPSTYSAHRYPIYATQQAYGNYTSGTATAEMYFYIH